MSGDVIAAIITPVGEGAVGAVRASGPHCWDTVSCILRTRDGRTPVPRDRRMTYGRAVDPRTGETLDEVLFAFMRGPRSYTGEDVVEIYGHGGTVTVRRLLRALFDAGCRPAEPGEFTRRAFVNGRIDLSQAEAVVDLIYARTEREADLALGQLDGRLSRSIAAVAEPLLAETAALEVELDFPEDEAAETEPEALTAKLDEHIAELERLAEQAEAGRLIRDGVMVAIIGPTNVGKSSLLNAMAGRPRAIVTEIAGTTRDAIEEWVDIDGIAFRLVDTAGIRETNDPVERIGVDLARRFLRQADLVLLMIDAGEEADVTRVVEIYREVGPKPAIIVLNKADLPERVTVEQARQLFPGRPVVRLSLLDGSGMEQLEHELLRHVFGGDLPATDGIVLASERHRRAVLDALESLRSARRLIQSRAETELVVADMRYALSALDRITGKDTSDEILNAIFSRFCVGK